MAAASVIFVSLQLLTLLTDNAHAQQTISCHAGTAYIGQPSNITCTFHKDVKVTQTAISVVMIPFTLRRDEEEREVLQCSWPQDKDKPLCLVTPGYVFDYDVTHRLTVEIPYTTRGYAGRYSCHVVPPDGATVQTCELIVTEEMNTFPSRQQATVSVDSGNSMGTPILILLILLVLLILPVFIVSLCYAWKTNFLSSCTSRGSSCLHSTRKKNASEQDDPEQQDPEAKDPGAECQIPPPYAKVSRYAKSRRTDYEEVTEDMLDPLLSASTTESPQAIPPVKDNKLDPLQSTSVTDSPNSNAHPPAKDETPNQAREDQPATFRTTASLTVNTQPQPAVSYRTVEKQERLHDGEDNERDQDGDLSKPSLIPAARSAKKASETSSSAASSDPDGRQPAHASEEKKRDAEATPTPRENRSAERTTADLSASAVDTDADRKSGQQLKLKPKSYPAPPPPFRDKN